MAYTSVRVPVDLMERVDSLLETAGMGYRSRSEFVIDSIRQNVMRVDQISDRLAERTQRAQEALVADLEAKGHDLPPEADED